AFGLLLAAPATAEYVKIGILFDVTGPETDSVPPALNAVKLAVDEVNANGGILKGQKLQTIVGDSQGTPQGSIDAATKLVKVDNVAAIVGALLSDSTITDAQAHEPNKNSYIQELTALAEGKPEALVLITYAAGGGITIIKEALEHGFFKQFIGTDSLLDDTLIKQVGADKLKGIFFTS